MNTEEREIHAAACAVAGAQAGMHGWALDYEVVAMIMRRRRDRDRYSEDEGVTTTMEAR